MRTRRYRLFALLFGCACLVAAAVGASQAAIVRNAGLELRAEGDFRPHELPRNHHAPIEFEGRATVRSVAGGPPPQLERLVLDFDKDGRLQTGGLPTCRASEVESLGVDAARRRCEDAIVGKGTVGAIVFIEGQWIRVLGEATLFNGPAEGGLATVVAHAQAVSLPDEIYVVEIPITRIKGDYRYRATVDIPQIFDGRGVLTSIKGEIGRKYKYKGRDRSYVSARCSDGALAVHGILTFAGGYVIDGSIEKYCVPKGVFARARPRALSAPD